MSKTTSFFNKLKLYTDVYKAGSMISLSNEKHLKLVLKELGWRIVTLSTLSTKETSRFRMLHNFGVFLLKMNKNHGPVYTVKYLKASQLCIQKKLAGQPFSSMREVEPDYNFPRLSKSGLPSIIKTIDRASICNNSYKIIRLYLSLFSLYRVIKVDFNPKLNTITDNFGGSKIHLDDFNRWLESNSKNLLQKFSSMDIKDLTSYRILPITKSSPLGSHSYRHLIQSYISLKNSSFWQDILEYIKCTNSKNFSILFSNIEFVIDRFKIRAISEYSHLGALSFKEEAAGKLRIFAMVDIITQSLLEPLHRTLFSLFKKFPNDCTHDQGKGFKYAQELSLKYNCSFGFDLSSATDRLPISSQVAILNSLFGIGSQWGSILTNRDYVIRKNNYNIPESSVRYSVGQPMGALSSWAMLNLVHHMMIQFIATHLNKTPKGVWYREYIVLGDDLVLFDKDVADRYLSLCNELGVSINLSKSIIAESKPVVEFAKRTSVNGVDVSALPFKELLTGNNFFGRLAITTRLIRNSWGKDPFKILTIGNRRKSDSKLDLIYPMIGFLTQLYQNRFIPLSSVLSLITNRDKPLSFFGRDIRWMKPDLISRCLKSYFKTGSLDKNLLPVRERFFSEVNSITFKVILLNRIDELVKRIDKISLLDCRINLLDKILTFPELEELKILHPEENLKPLTERIYFSKIRSILINISPLSDIYFTRDRSVVSMRSLRLGLDVDLNLGKGVSLKTLKYKLVYLNEFRSNDNYFQSQRFIDLKLEDLLRHLEELKSIYNDLEFFKDKKDSNKEVIDNPLKVLDFIKDINNPKYHVQSDFVKFDNQYIDSSALVDKEPGFKPRFDFGSKAKKISFTFK